MIDINLTETGRLLGVVREIREQARPGSRAVTRFQGALYDLVVTDYREMLLGGYDRHGKGREPLAPATLRKRAGSGPSLVPRGLGSRFWTAFRAEWHDFGGSPFLSVGYEGLPFAPYHLSGATRPGTRWVLPRRDVGGLSPQGRDRLGTLLSDFAGDLVRFGGDAGKKT